MGRDNDMADAGPVVNVIREDWADPSLALPNYATAGAAGADLRANFPAGQQRTGGVSLAPMQRVLVPTGLRMQIPAGFEGQIRPRSGLALKHGVTLVNTPGTLDSDYRGPVGILLINLGAEPFLIGHGERIAQMVVAPVARAQFMPVATLNQSRRGAGGFGSTGQR